MAYDIPIRQCEYCDDDFAPRSNGQKFCTAECRKKAAFSERPRYDHRQCESCGATFTPTTNFSVCCSGKCYSSKWLAVPANRDSQLEGNRRRYKEDPEYRAMQLEYQSKLRSDPEYKHENTKYMKRRNSDPAVMESRRKYDRDRYANNPEARLKRLESQKRRRAKLKEQNVSAA